MGSTCLDLLREEPLCVAGLSSVWDKCKIVGSQSCPGHRTFLSGHSLRAILSGHGQHSAAVLAAARQLMILLGPVLLVVKSCGHGGTAAATSSSRAAVFAMFAVSAVFAVFVLCCQHDRGVCGVLAARRRRHCQAGRVGLAAALPARACCFLLGAVNANRLVVEAKKSAKIPTPTALPAWCTRF
jgi:hypothetical protein